MINIEKIPSPKPYWIDFPLGMHRSAQNVAPFTPKNLMHLVDQLPLDAMFMTMGVADASMGPALDKVVEYEPLLVPAEMVGARKV